MGIESLTGGGKNGEHKWYLTKCPSQWEKDSEWECSTLENYGYTAFFFFYFFYFSFNTKAEAESLGLFNKNESLPDSILRCLAEVRELFIETT